MTLHLLVESGVAHGLRHRQTHRSDGKVRPSQQSRTDKTSFHREQQLERSSPFWVCLHLLDSLLIALERFRPEKPATPGTVRRNATLKAGRTLQQTTWRPSRACVKMDIISVQNSSISPMASCHILTLFLSLVWVAKAGRHGQWASFRHVSGQTGCEIGARFGWRECGWRVRTVPSTII